MAKNKRNHLISLANVNVRSLLPSFASFSLLVADNYDIICVTETWLNINIPSEIVSLPGYNFYRKDRVNRVGGGVGVYVRANLLCETIDINVNNTDIEFILLKITIGTYKLALIAIYRPPNTMLSNIVNLFDEIVPQLLVKYDYSIITGDLNIDMLKPSLLFSTLHTYGFLQLIDEPTRITNTSSTCLDPIFINSEKIIVPCGTIVSDISDHNKMPFCLLNIKTEKPKQKFIYVRDFKNLNLLHFQDDITKIPWNNIFYIENINDKVRFLEDNINILFSMHAPFKTIRVSKPSAPWLTDNLRMILKERDKALYKYKNNKTPENWNHYKELRNFALASVRREKTAYAESLESSGPKKFWQGLRHLNIKISSHNNADLPPNLCDPNAINDYFISVFNKSDNCKKKIHYYSNNQFSEKTFSFSLVDQHTVQTIIDGIRSNASGSDGITLEMLQLCTPQIIDHVTNLINSCLEVGYFPRPWRESVVCPIPKKPNPETTQDLRPISLLPIISKVLERIVYVQISQYISDNNILPSQQSGFREGHSTVTALLNITDNIIRALDKKLAVIMIALDYSKAFDVIDHDLLVAKLKFYGCNDVVLSFFKSYLWNRSQRVRIDGNYSVPDKIISGVPQGSILGPLLFLLYTSDLSHVVEWSEVYQYADDTQLVHCFDPDHSGLACEHINADLSSILQYSTEHNLTINPNKTKLLLFAHRKRRAGIENNICIEIGGVRLSFTNKVKILGLNIDSSLRFQDHISAILQKCYLRMRLLYANRYILNFKTRKKLSNSLVLSILNYSLIVYYPCLDKITQLKLQRVQNTCVRFVWNLRKFDHISGYINQLQWLKMSLLFKFYYLTFIYRLFKDQRPNYLLEKLIYRNVVHDKNIRHITLTMPHHATALFARSYTYNAVSLYNRIRPNLLCSPFSFKKVYKAFFLQEQIQN